MQQAPPFFFLSLSLSGLINPHGVPFPGKCLSSDGGVGVTSSLLYLLASTSPKSSKQGKKGGLELANCKVNKRRINGTISIHGN